jgi:hypothetical protein
MIFLGQKREKKKNVVMGAGRGAGVFDLLLTLVSARAASIA